MKCIELIPALCYKWKLKCFNKACKAKQNIPKRIAKSFISNYNPKLPNETHRACLIFKYFCSIPFSWEFRRVSQCDASQSAKFAKTLDTKLNSSIWLKRKADVIIPEIYALSEPHWNFWLNLTPAWLWANPLCGRSQYQCSICGALKPMSCIS